MELNVTYHWTYLDYLSPNFKTGYWAPIARATIEVHADLPTADEPKQLHGMYTHISIPITGTMDPKEEIIQSIQKFAEEQNITIEMDCINGKADCGWYESF